MTETMQVPRRRRTGVVLGVVGIVAVLGVAGAATVRGLTADPAASSESMTFAPEAQRLVVDVGSGDVTVGRAGGSSVEVTRIVRSRGSATPTFTETSTAEGVSLAAGCDGWIFGSCSVDYEVLVPDGFALDLRASSGEVRAAGLAVGAATVRVASGDIHLADLRGPVSLELSSGEVSAERLDSPTFTATSSSGDVTVDFATPPTAVDVSVSSGEVSVALPPQGRYRVEADTGSGEQAVSVPSDDTASSTVRIETSSGDVTVHPR